MTKIELGLKLKEMYDNALQGELVTMIHLFGIKYASQIKKSGASFKDIAVAAGLGKAYGTEISKGSKLSKYVVVK
jgi:5-methylcytosine-specific restriction protein B